MRVPRVGMELTQAANGAWFNALPNHSSSAEQETRGGHQDFPASGIVCGEQRQVEMKCEWVMWISHVIRHLTFIPSTAMAYHSLSGNHLRRPSRLVVQLKKKKKFARQGDVLEFCKPILVLLYPGIINLIVLATEIKQVLTNFYYLPVFSFFQSPVCSRRKELLPDWDPYDFLAHTRLCSFFFERADTHTHSRPHFPRNYK